MKSGYPANDCFGARMKSGYPANDCFRGRMRSGYPANDCFWGRMRSGYLANDCFGIKEGLKGQKRVIWSWPGSRLACQLMI